MGCTDTEFTARQCQRGQLAASAARLARDPVAGPYLFGTLATTLADDNRLGYLAAAVTSAEAFVTPGDSAAREAADLRQTAANLDRHLVEHPAAFGKASHALVAQAFMALNQAAAAIEAAGEAVARDAVWPMASTLTADDAQAQAAVRAGTFAHPAELTAHRLLSHADRWQYRLSPSELAAIATAREALLRIASQDGASDHPAATVIAGECPST